jgi:hypothetical protein
MEGFGPSLSNRAWRNKVKKIVFILGIVSVLFMACDFTPSGAQVATQAQLRMADKAAVSVPIPEVSYFQEKRTIAKWATYWDKPNLPTYVYLFVFNNCIGYYVTDGKPASTRSYMMPEEAYQKMAYGDYSSSYNWNVTQAPDIDGTYGDNNPGIRFFTASGIPVEFGGAGASYLYSAYPLPINVPELSKK